MKTSRIVLWSSKSWRDGSRQISGPWRPSQVQVIGSGTVQLRRAWFIFSNCSTYVVFCLSPQRMSNNIAGWMWDYQNVDLDLVVLVGVTRYIACIYIFVISNFCSRPIFGDRDWWMHVSRLFFDQSVNKLDWMFERTWLVLASAVLQWCGRHWSR